MYTPHAMVSQLTVAYIRTSRPATVFAEVAQAPLLLAVTQEGGHSMTWPEGRNGGGRAWSIAVLLEWLQACLELDERPSPRHDDAVEGGRASGRLVNPLV